MWPWPAPRPVLGAASPEARQAEPRAACLLERERPGQSLGTAGRAEGWLSEAKPGAEPDAATLCHAELPGPGGFEAHGPSCPISLRPHVAANAFTLHTGNSRWQSFVLEGQQGHQVSALHGQARKHSPGRVRCRRSGLTILRWRPHCVPGPRQAQSASSPRRTRHAPPGGQHEPEAATQGPRRGGLREGWREGRPLQDGVGRGHRRTGHRVLAEPRPTRGRHQA